MHAHHHDASLINAARGGLRLARSQYSHQRLDDGQHGAIYAKDAFVLRTSHSLHQGKSMDVSSRSGRVRAAHSRTRNTHA